MDKDIATIDTMMEMATRILDAWCKEHRDSFSSELQRLSQLKTPESVKSKIRKKTKLCLH